MEQDKAFNETSIIYNYNLLCHGYSYVSGAGYRSVLTADDSYLACHLPIHLAKTKDFGSVRMFEAGASIGPHKGDMWGLGLLMRGLICVLLALPCGCFYVLEFKTCRSRDFLG